MRKCLLFLAALAATSVALAADKAEQLKKARSYEDAAEECEKAIDLSRHELADEYSSAVWTLKQRFQKDGNLEKALATDKEWSRAIQRKLLTSKDVVDFPPELATLQKEYVERFASIEQATATKFLQDLQREAAELATAGKLNDGRILQKEIDTIKRLYLGSRDGTSGLSGKPEGDVIAACEEAIRQKRVAVQAQYVGEMEALEKSFQAKGELEDLFAAKAERKRFMETPLLAEENLVETPDALRELQQKYLELQQNVTTSVAEEFIARLEQQKQALTIEGKLDEAVKAKTDAENIRDSYLASKQIAPNKAEVRNLLCKQKWMHFRPGINFIYSFKRNGKYVLEGTPRHGVYEISPDEKLVYLRWDTDGFVNTITVGSTLEDWSLGGRGDDGPFKPIK